MPAVYTISAQSSPFFEEVLSKLIYTTDKTTDNTDNHNNLPQSPKSINAPNAFRIKNVNTKRINVNNDDDVSGQKNYKVLNYQNDKMNNAMYGTCGILKSLLFTEGNKLLSFSPPKAQNSENFVDMFPDLSKLQVEEFVDGTMINLFWDTAHDEWEISTRRKVGANS